MNEKKPSVELDPQYETFCLEYIKDFNGRRAAIAAGYSEVSAHVQATRLLKNDNVQIRLKELVCEKMDSLNVNKESVIREMARLAFSDLSHYFDKNGNITLEDFKKLTPDQTAALADVRQVQTKDGPMIRVKLYDKLKALELLGRYLNLFAADESSKININIIQAIKLGDKEIKF